MTTPRLTAELVAEIRADFDGNAYRGLSLGEVVYAVNGLLAYIAVQEAELETATGHARVLLSPDMSMDEFDAARLWLEDYDKQKAAS